MDPLLLILIVGALAIAIAYYAIREDKQNKEIEKLAAGYKPWAIDRDNDGILQEGTPFERKAPVKKKAAAPKKKPATKAKPAAKAKPKAKAPAKKKPVAKKKAK